MKAMKKVLVSTLAAVLLLGTAAPASAAGSPVKAPTPKKQIATVKVGGNTVKVKTTAKGTASISSVKSSKTSVTVASKITIGGVSYKVTAIEANAFKGCKKVKKVTIPATVSSISKNAFKGCKKLTTITIKSKKITVKKGAFSGLNTKKMKIKAPKMSNAQLKKFKKAMKKAGFKGKVTK